MKIYQDNIKKYTEEAEKLGQSLNRLSTLRLIVFLAMIIIIAFLANAGQMVLLLIMAPVSVIAFMALMKRYHQVSQENRTSVFLKELNETELQRLDGKLSDFDPGTEFLTTDHAYVSDFDIFGNHSLFQLVNRTTTESGNQLLAKWLSAPASKTIIEARQTAIKELSNDLEWRQSFQAAGMAFANKKSQYQKLLNWIKTPVQLLPQKIKYFVAAAFLSIAALASGVYYIINAAAPDWPRFIWPLAVVLFINWLILKKIKPIAEKIINNTHQNVKTLAGYHALIRKIETRNFDAAILQNLKTELSKAGYSAANEINGLKKILHFFQQRGTKQDLFGGNKFYPLINFFFLTDIYWIVFSEQWKVRNSAHLAAWAAAVSEFEVLNSLAGFAYSNPSFTFPEIKEAPYSIHFQQLGHPLLPEAKRVCNDFDLEGRGEIDMITGSNMAGKSTFLRTVGINLVLAFIGAPCCANTASVSSMRIFSSMRTQDNLEEGISSFYAELRRVETLLKLLEQGEPIFFMLDEMFKGTNSKDRHKGGFSLIKQLADLNAFGLISTHDLDLATLAGKHELVTNYSFNSEIREGEMLFNYTLTPKLCTDFNASELMKRSGIRVLSNIDGL
ncbi:MAG: DNA mismatch repair protein MutS [Roseivirga sp.]|nr:DNA mismatch repair protein MutS [Roseivirga sp.]